MGNVIVLPRTFLNEVVKRLENDPTVQRILEAVDPQAPIVVETVKATYLSSVIGDLRTARSHEEVRPHQNRKTDAQFIPYFLRTKYPDRVR